VLSLRVNGVGWQEFLVPEEEARQLQGWLRVLEDRRPRRYS
jgi:acylphosphatase